MSSINTTLDCSAEHHSIGRIDQIGYCLLSRNEQELGWLLRPANRPSLDVTGSASALETGLSVKSASHSAVDEPNGVHSIDELDICPQYEPIAWTQLSKWVSVPFAEILDKKTDFGRDSGTIVEFGSHSFTYDAGAPIQHAASDKNAESSALIKINGHHAISSPSSVFGQKAHEAFEDAHSHANFEKDSGEYKLDVEGNYEHTTLINDHGAVLSTESQQEYARSILDFTPEYLLDAMHLIDLSYSSTSTELQRDISRGWSVLGAEELNMSPYYFGRWPGDTDYLYDNVNLQGFVARKGNVLAIAFTGTSSPLDILSDIQGGLYDWSLVYGGYNPLISGLINYYLSNPEITNIISVGHSLGGAMAEFFLDDYGPQISGLTGFTIGSPV